MLSCLVYMSHTTTRLKFFNTAKKFYYGIFRFRFIPRKMFYSLPSEDNVNTFHDLNSMFLVFNSYLPSTQTTRY